MQITSINETLNNPENAVLIRAQPVDGWFVATYKVNGAYVQVFYNQSGREVFRLDFHYESLWEKIKRMLKGIYDADSDPSQVM